MKQGYWERSAKFSPDGLYNLLFGLDIEIAVEQTQVRHKLGFLLAMKNISRHPISFQERRRFFTAQKQTAKVYVKIIDRRQRDLKWMNARGELLRSLDHFFLAIIQIANQRHVRRKKWRGVLVAELRNCLAQFAGDFPSRH